MSESSLVCFVSGAKSAAALAYCGGNFRGQEGLLECRRQDDPEPVKRLKREMAVALSEEDYSSAARIRDHPFMKLAVQIIQERLAGRETEAKALQVKLQNAVKGQ